MSEHMACQISGAKRHLHSPEVRKGGLVARRKARSGRIRMVGAIAVACLAVLTPWAAAKVGHGSALPAGAPHAGVLARQSTGSGSQVVPAYEYKIAFSGSGELSSSDSSGDGWDDSQAAEWNVDPSQPVQLWLETTAGAYTMTAHSLDSDPTAGSMIENGHWPYSASDEEAYSCQGPVGVHADALFTIGLGPAPTIRTEFAGSGMAAGLGAGAVGAAPGSCTNTPSYSGIDGMNGFFVFWVPPGFTGAGTPASGEMMAVGAPIPPQDVGKYSFTILARDYSQVTDATACPFSGGGPDPSCMPKFQLFGKYDFTEVCPGKVAVGAGGAPTGTCFSDKKLKDAAQAAKDAAQQEQEDHYNYKVNCTGELAAGFNRSDPGAKAFCLALAATYEYDAFEQDAEQNIADDPPDSAYSKVAAPHAPPVNAVGKLRRALPATQRLLRGELQVTGLLGAVTTALNRSSGALLAVSAGDTAAARDMTRQQKAARSYAKQAARLLGGEHRLALKAAAELRRAVSSIHAPS
ncbi:MAG: hypothetical protein ACRDOD_09930, partial [Streptosporangiaceae bacterium]